MNTLGKVYNLDLDTSKMFEAKEAIRKLLIEQYDNLVDAPDELASILESTSKCINIHNHLTNSFKFVGSQYTDSMLESNLKDTLDKISVIINAKSGYNFLSDKWYNNQGLPLLKELEKSVKDLQSQFLSPSGGGAKMTF